MKNLFLFKTLFLFSFLGFKSQNSVFKITNITTGTSVVNNSDVFYHATAPGTTIVHDFEVKNISGSTQTLSVRRYDDIMNTVSVNDKAEAYFCTGITCYQPSNTTAPIVLNANEVVVFKADFIEASSVGQSSVRYKFNNAANVSDALTFTLEYNNPLSVKQNTTLFTTISSVFPNPCSVTAHLNITSIKSVEIIVSILNILGETVDTKYLNLNTGVNTLAFDVENLNSGIYFISMNDGSSVISKKVIINK